MKLPLAGLRIIAVEQYRGDKGRLASRGQLTRDLDAVLENPFAQGQGRTMEAPHPTHGTIRTLACPVRSPQSEDCVGIAPAWGEHMVELLGELACDDSRARLLRPEPMPGGWTALMGKPSIDRARAMLAHTRQEAP